jgi:hypothetical protein
MLSPMLPVQLVTNQHSLPLRRRSDPCPEFLTSINPPPWRPPELRNYEDVVRFLHSRRRCKSLPQIRRNAFGRLKRCCSPCCPSPSNPATANCVGATRHG